MVFFQSELKKALRDTLSSVVWTLIDNGKLAHARLAAIVMKIKFTAHARLV